MADDKLVKYVKKSSYRSKVLKTLGNDAKMPKEIANDSGILPNHISNVLRQLKDKEIVLGDLMNLLTHKVFDFDIIERAIKFIKECHD